MKKSVVIVLLMGAAALSQPAWFEYDRSAPLDYQEKLVSTSGGVRICDSSYASPKGGRVRAYTVTPDRSGRFAGIVWQHGGGQFRNWFLPDAVALAKAGVVSILMDAPGNRPSEMRGPIPPGNVESFQ